jgi:hypothetical protein
MMKNLNKRPRLAGIVAVAVAMLLSVGAVAVGVYAMANTPPVPNVNNAFYVSIPTPTHVVPDLPIGRPSVELFEEYEEWGITFEGLYPYPNHNSRFIAREVIDVFYHGRLVRGISDFCDIAGLNMTISSATYEGSTWIHVIRDESGYIAELDITETGEHDITRNYFSFEIPYVAEGAVAFIGRVHLGPDNPLTVVISEYESEHGFFLGLTDSSDVQTKVDTHWIPFFGNQRVEDNNFTFTSDYSTTVYLYIGNGHGTSGIIGENVFFDIRSNVGNSPLANVSGRIYMNTDGLHRRVLTSAFDGRTNFIAEFNPATGIISFFGIDGTVFEDVPTRYEQTEYDFWKLVAANARTIDELYGEGQPPLLRRNTTIFCDETWRVYWYDGPGSQTVWQLTEEDFADRVRLETVTVPKLLLEHMQGNNR